MISIVSSLGALDGVSGTRESLLAMLRQIARSRTEDTFNKALNNLEESNEWKSNLNLRRWFQNTWLKHKKASTANVTDVCICN